jgi:hypothetical protein
MLRYSRWLTRRHGAAAARTRAGRCRSRAMASFIDRELDRFHATVTSQARLLERAIAIRQANGR